MGSLLSREDVEHLLILTPLPHTSTRDSIAAALGISDVSVTLKAIARHQTSDRHALLRFKSKEAVGRTN